MNSFYIKYWVGEYDAARDKLIEMWHKEGGNFSYLTEEEKLNRRGVIRTCRASGFQFPSLMEEWEEVFLNDNNQ